MVARLRRLASHPWTKLAARAFAVACGLLILVLIGRTARAVPQALSNASGPAESAARPLPTPAPNPPTSASALLPSPVVSHARRATVDDPVHINSAALDDLERLPGIGPKRGTAILNLRAKLVHFREIEDLMRVKGIGRATLKKLRPLVRLD